MDLKEVYSSPSGIIVSPLRGQLVPMNVTLSPRDVWISLPDVLKGTYGQPSFEDWRLVRTSADVCCGRTEAKAEDESREDVSKPTALSESVERDV